MSMLTVKRGVTQKHKRLNYIRINVNLSFVSTVNSVNLLMQMRIISKLSMSHLPQDEYKGLIVAHAPDKQTNKQIKIIAPINMKARHDVRHLSISVLNGSLIKANHLELLF